MSGRTWTRYEVGSNQIIKTYRAGRECYQMTTARDEPCGKWGDGADGKIRKRAEFRENEFHEIGVPWSIEFSTLIPGDWEFNDAPCDIANMHQFKAPGTTPFMLQVRKDSLMIATAFPGGKFNPQWSGLIVPEQWDDWHIDYLPMTTESGFLYITRNGNAVVELIGIQTAYEDEKANYFKTGIYLYESNVPVSDLPRWRRLFVQIPE